MSHQGTPQPCPNNLWLKPPKLLPETPYELFSTQEPEGAFANAGQSMLPPLIKTLKWLHIILCTKSNVQRRSMSPIWPGPWTTPTPFRTALASLPATPQASRPARASGPLHLDSLPVMCRAPSLSSFRSPLSGHHLRETWPRYSVWSLSPRFPCHSPDHSLAVCYLYISPAGRHPHYRVRPQGPIMGVKRSSLLSEQA